MVVSAGAALVTLSCSGGEFKNNRTLPELGVLEDADGDDRMQRFFKEHCVTNVQANICLYTTQSQGREVNHVEFYLRVVNCITN